MTMTIRDAYVAFRKKYPTRKLGFTSFFKLKPKNVKKVSETNRKCCLCQLCCNASLALEAINNFSIGKQTDPCPKQLSKQEAANLSVCSYDGQDYPHAKCLNNECENCGTCKVRHHYKGLEEKYGEEEITYYRLESILVHGKEGNTKRCVSCFEKKTPVKSFMTVLEETLKPLPSHMFRGKWQLQRLEKCKDNLKTGEAVVVMDFADNYSCRFQNEVQSAFWDTNQVTIHPMMAYYLDNDGEKDRIKKHSVIGVTNDVKHDAHVVNVFRERLWNSVNEQHPGITTMYEWTDGCASQYKGRVGFADISNEENCSLERNFFETSHGTNVCDGLGAIVKNSCHQAVISGKQVIENATELYSYCKGRLSLDNTESKREFVYVELCDVERDRPSTHADTLPGTRKLHSVREIRNPGELLTRNLSCYCDGCKEGEQCYNAPYVMSWESKTLKTKPSKSGTSNGNIPEKKVDPSRVTKHKKTGWASYSKNGYVSVRLNGNQSKSKEKFVAQVVDLDTASGEAQLSFMVQKGGVYLWPDEPDISWEPTSSVIDILPEPILSQKSTNRRNYFVFK